MDTRIPYSGPITTAIPYEIRCKSSAFLLLKSAGTFAATLHHLSVRSSNEPYTIDDFTELTPVVSLTEAINYKQTLGGGNYAIVFTAASADVTITVTE